MFYEEYHMLCKSVIFDLDGTLLDTLEDLGTSLNQVLNRAGYPSHTMDAYREFVGEGAEKLVFRALPEEERHDGVIRSCLQAFKEEYANRWNVKTKPYTGIAQLLNELTSRKIKLAVLSNKPHRYTKMCVSNLLSDWTFDVVLGQRESVPRKPDPAGALEATSSLGAQPKECLFVGDTGIDMHTAAAAGIFSVGVLWGFRSEDELLEHGANALISQPLELLTLLDSLPS